MRTLALRLYGKNDLRLEEFELPDIKDDEILADIVSNSICMSCHKAAMQGADHKRVPKDVARASDHHRPRVLRQHSPGREEVAKTSSGPGRSTASSPPSIVPGRELEAPGYSFRYIGGNATKIIIPREVLERDCLLPYNGEGYFKASLSEPVSCIVGAFQHELPLHGGGIRPQDGHRGRRHRGDPRRRRPHGARRRRLRAPRARASHACSS